MAARRQPSDEIQATVELRRQRHDADVRRGTVDFIQDVVGSEGFRRDALTAGANAPEVP